VLASRYSLINPNSICGTIYFGQVRYIGWESECSNLAGNKNTVIVEFDSLEPHEDYYCLLGKPFNGTAVYRRPDGTIESEVSFVDGVQSGIFTDLFPNGQLAAQGVIRNGVYHGEYKTWDADGTLLKTETYEFGIRTSKTEYGPNGEELSKEEITREDPNYALLELFRGQAS
jgi:antitoxin component YwqK of YwqJK toxin-antitoxin module